ncbi:MAG: tartrate dehydrogenase [Bacilli bacterium]|nr:tartrate dehydrogenase [Bacilli bacterium]
MKTYQIAVIPGDGIGKEVVAEGVKVLKKIAELDKNFDFNFDYFPWGCEYYLKTKKMMDDDGLEQLRKYDAIYLGAVGFPTVPDHLSLRELLLKIRTGFDQYVNLRPVKLLKGAPCPLKGKEPKDIDFVVIRENSEGEYAGLGEWHNKGQSDEFVYQTGKFTRKGVERIIRYAFELARREGRHKVTSVTKGNALNYSMVFWDQVFHEVAKEYPDIESNQLMVDAASMTMVLRPETLDVVVTSNLFGDILTDLGAAIAGGMGLAAGDNLNPEKKYPSMFESIHGSAPDIAGKGIANPIAQIWAAGGLLRHLGYVNWYNKLIESFETLLTEKKVLTPDLGGKCSTSDVGDELCRILERGF